MASQGGLTRRRGAGGGAANGDEESSSRVASPGPRSTNSYTDRTPETAYEDGENGHKIAYDPRDISENAERSKQPKLTLMEEILLLGLKDKQVSENEVLAWLIYLFLRLRATYRFGTTTFPTLYEAA